LAGRPRLDNAPPLVRELANAAPWLEQQTIVPDECYAVPGKLSKLPQRARTSQLLHYADFAELPTVISGNRLFPVR
jgi:hypothetical protein